MSQIGIFRLTIPTVSETFIFTQASWFKKYVPLFIAKQKLDSIDFDSVSISDMPHCWFKQRFFAATRSPRFFVGNDTVKKLRLVHAHFGLDAVYALPLAMNLGVPLVTTFHGYDVTTSENLFLTSFGVTGKYYYFCRRSLQMHGALFVAVSDFIKNRLVQSGYPQEKIVRHYIGVDVEKITPSPTGPSEDRYVLCVGRHTEVKGIDSLLLAFSKIAHKHPQVKLVQVGTGPLTSELLSIVEAFGLKGQVVFLGSQSHASVLELMRGAEVFALTSNTAKSGASEALGIVFNEASAAGVPVISTLHGGIPEAVIDNETGLLAPERDVDAIADRLDALLSDRALGRRMGLMGREYVGDCFNIKSQTAKLELLYDNLIQ